MTDNANLIADARALIADCATYNFGMRSANKLAHEVAGRLADALEAQSAQLVADSREALAQWERKTFAVSNGTQTWAEFQGPVGSITESLLASEVVSLAADRERAMKKAAWFEGFEAGWAECSDPGAFVNDVWDAKTPNPYRESEARND